MNEPGTRTNHWDGFVTWTRRTTISLRPFTNDMVLALLIMAFASASATSFLSAHGQRSNYLLKYYGPAVMVAAGHGFVQPFPKNSSPLYEFLRLDRTSITLEEIPADIKTGSPRQFELLHRYALVLIGWWWRLFGISWPALNGLHALFFGITCTCAYGLLRLGTNRPIAFLLALMFMTSPGMYHVLPQFRDFSKAPFLMAALLLIAIPVRYRVSWHAMLCTGLASGVVLGLGLGFRHDFMVVVPVACAVIGLFWAGAWRQTWLPRLASVLLLLLAFALLGAPMLQAAEEGANSTHNVVLGFSKPFSDVMGLHAPYEIGRFYDDAYAHTRTSAYNFSHSSRVAAAGLWQAEYEIAGRDYLIAIARTFPADIVRRALRAVEIVLRDAPFTVVDYPQIYQVSPFVEELSNFRVSWLGALRSSGVVLAGIAYLLIAAFRLRWALGAAFMILMLAGYTSLQFHLRHYFPYEIFFFFVLGCMAQACLSLISACWRPPLRAHLLGSGTGFRLWRWPAIRRMSLAAIVLLSALGAGYGATLAWQRHAVGDLYAAYAEAARQPLTTSVVDSEHGPVLKPENFLNPRDVTPREKAFRVQAGVLAVKVRSSAKPFAIEFIYDATPKNADLSQKVSIPATATPEDWWIYMPVFQTVDKYFGTHHRTFLGIKSYGAASDGFQGIYSLQEMGKLPLLVTLTMPEKLDAS